MITKDLTVTDVKGKGRPTPLEDEEYLDVFSKAVAEGLNSQELAALFSRSDRTMRTWKNDPRVKQRVLKFLEDRVIRITRKTDNIIEQRLEHAEKLDTEVLLKIRKEYLGGVLRKQTQGSKEDVDTIHQAQQAIENNPEFAAQFQKLLEGKSVEPEEPVIDAEVVEEV